MGFIAGDPVPWRRWWFSDDAEVATRDGILLDPSDEYARYLNPDASHLAEYMECRGIILLADAGMGKSFELNVEVDRRRSLGHRVICFDLGEFATATEVEEAVRAAGADWQASTSEELTLAFDGSTSRFSKSPTSTMFCCENSGGLTGRACG